MDERLRSQENQYLHVLAGQSLGIKDVDDGFWLVSFMHYDRGTRRAGRYADLHPGKSVNPRNVELMSRRMLSRPRAVAARLGRTRSGRFVR